MNILKELLNFSSAFKICKLLIENGSESRFIGGCVRDIILGKTPTDIDIATTLPPDKIEGILAANKIEFFTIGKDFGTITAILNKEKIEITTLRKDIKCDGRYAEVKFTDSWKEDASRRDFTINAISADIEGNLYDYWGGINDLNNKSVKFIGDPEKRIQEDYLRILRFFRFSAYFAKSINQEGLKASKKYSNKLKELSGYRVKTEFERLFSSPRFLQTLDLMSEEGILQNAIGANNVAIKYLKRMQQIAIQLDLEVSTSLYWASLLRDFTFSNIPFSRTESKILKKLIDSKDSVLLITDLKKLWQIYKNDFKNIIIYLIAIEKVEPNIAAIKQLIKRDIIPLPITGRDLVALNIKPGKNIGILLEKAEQIWYENDFKISKQELLRNILEYES